MQTYQKKSPEESGGKDIAHGAGCTACSAIITPTEIIVGNAGDSRAVLGKKQDGSFVAVDLSIDHKPDL